MLRGGGGSFPLSLGEEGDTSGANEEARGTTRHKLAKCGRHPKNSQVLARVGRGSLGTVPDEGCTSVRRRSGASWARWVPRTARGGWLEAKCGAARGEDAMWGRSMAEARAPY